MTERRSPLQGVRVIDLAAYIAGAYCSTLLADMGADVVKVESPAGDAFRVLGGSFQAWNRGKRAMILNLASPEGRSILHRMVADADVVVENYRKGAAEKLGADYDTLRAVTPRIIYCSVTGYGLTGPYSSQPGFDPLLQAQSGAMTTQGGKGSPPVFLRVAISDYAGAMLSAFGVAAALLHRARTGIGQRVEASLLRGAVAVQAVELFSYPDSKPVPRSGDKGETACYRLYEGSDDWFFLSCRDDESFASVCEVVSRPDLAQRYAHEEQRMEHDSEIAAAFEAAFAADTRAAWISRLQGAGVRCAVSNRMADLHQNAYAIERGFTVDAESPDLGPIKQMGLPFEFSGTPGKIHGPAPAHGQHTDEVLSEAGYSTDEIASLRERGIVS